jgi:purine-binding chemotaxis protein CheW
MSEQVSEGIVQNEVLEDKETYLAFTMEKEQYALKAAIVREVFTMLEIYPIPMVPDYIKGVINLRGDVIPILDLSLLFYNHPIEVNKLTSMIIVEIIDNDESVVFGILVDDVNEVVKIGESEIEHTPDFGANINPAFISGILNNESNYLILLAADQLFDIDKLAEY